MNLATYTFLIAFLPVTATAVFLTHGPRLRRAVLLVAGLGFVGLGHLWALPVMCALALFAFWWGRVIERHPKRAARGGGIVLLVAILATYKYLPFFFGDGVSLLPDGVIAFLKTTIPIGLSFATFQYIAYFVDIARGTIPAEKRLTTFLGYAFFFPNLTAGPLARYGALAPQLTTSPRPDWTHIQQGVLLLLCGLAKKVLLADPLGATVDRLWTESAPLVGSAAWLAILGYGLQLLMDFSGYSDMAIGAARLFGITLPPNFNAPYRADSPSDFWRRWHMTLGAWVRDYVYIPLGGSRTGMTRTILNGILAMTIIGLWHGAAWTFVVWGAYHGLLLGLFRLIKTPWEKLPRLLRQAVTVGLVFVGWSFFRAPNIPAALEALAGLSQWSHSSLPTVSTFIPLIGAALVAWILPEPARVVWGTKKRTALLFAVILVACVLFMNYRQASFLYYQF